LTADTEGGLTDVKGCRIKQRIFTYADGVLIGGYVFVYPQDISKPITKLDVEMFHHES